MRLLILFAFAALLTACATSNKATTADATTPATDSPGYTAEPTDLEGPAYDPSTSPQPMTTNTVLPKPPSYTPPATERPAAYGSTGTDTFPAPASYGSTPAADVMATKGTNATPTTYSNGVAQLPVGKAAVLAGQLTGLWTNTSDPREVVEFTNDHYSTFYDGEMLFQEAMQYHASCPGDCSGGTPLGISCFTIAGPAGTDCYGILRLTPEVLELSMLGVSTETIVYTKK
ncbi:MAG: hypothetical protein AAFZ52_09900 [Bacteroidota bacterium]